MQLKPDETFCINSSCRRVYKKKEKDLFGMCEECDKKEVASLIKLKCIPIGTKSAFFEENKKIRNKQLERKKLKRKMGIIRKSTKKRTKKINISLNER